MQVVIFLENCMQTCSVFIYTHTQWVHTFLNLKLVHLIFEKLFTKAYLKNTLLFEFQCCSLNSIISTINKRVLPSPVYPHTNTNTETPENLSAYYIGPCCGMGFYSLHTSPIENSICIHRYLYMKKLFKQDFQQADRNRLLYGNVPMSPCQRLSLN